MVSIPNQMMDGWKSKISDAALAFAASTATALPCPTAFKARRFIDPFNVRWGQYAKTPQLRPCTFNKSFDVPLKYKHLYTQSHQFLFVAGAANTVYGCINMHLAIDRLHKLKDLESEVSDLSQAVAPLQLRAEKCQSDYDELFDMYAAMPQLEECNGLEDFDRFSSWVCNFHIQSIDCKQSAQDLKNETDQLLKHIKSLEATARVRQAESQGAVGKSAAGAAGSVALAGVACYVCPPYGCAYGAWYAASIATNGVAIAVHSVVVCMEIKNIQKVGQILAELKVVETTLNTLSDDLETMIVDAGAWQSTMRQARADCEARRAVLVQHMNEARVDAEDKIAAQAREIAELKSQLASKDGSAKSPSRDYLAAGD